MIRLKSKVLEKVVPITFDGEVGEHNLIGLVLSDANYKARHNGNTFPACKTRSGAYPTVASKATVDR